jgi:hypothetical protein
MANKNIKKTERTCGNCLFCEPSWTAPTAGTDAQGVTTYYITRKQKGKYVCHKGFYDNPVVNTKNLKVSLHSPACSKWKNAALAK